MATKKATARKTTAKKTTARKTARPAAKRTAKKAASKYDGNAYYWGGIAIALCAAGAFIVLALGISAISR